MRVPLDSLEITPFQQRVYEAALKIPYGRFTTYKWLGLAIGCHSPRAIGQALRRNPVAPEVPCHRIIAADLTVGGFAGERSGPEISKKMKRLRQEGVVFKEGKVAKPELLYKFGLEQP